MPILRLGGEPIFNSNISPAIACNALWLSRTNDSNFGTQWDRTKNKLMFISLLSAFRGIYCVVCRFSAFRMKEWFLLNSAEVLFPETIRNFAEYLGKNDSARSSSF